MNYIYKITNDITNKIYIGQTTKTIEKRWQEHLKEALNTNSKKNTALYASMRKYGIEHFHIELVEEVDESISLDEREQYWIAFYNSYGQPYGYNETIGGNLFSKDINPMNVPEIRHKVSDSQKKNSYWKTEEHRECQRQRWLGENNPAKKEENRLKTSERVSGSNNPACRSEVKEKIRNKALGRKASDETKKKMSENNGRYWLGKKLPQTTVNAMSKARSEKLSGYNNPAAKPFAMITENGTIVKTFGVYKEAASYIYNSDLLHLVIPPSKGSNKGIITEGFISSCIRKSIKDDLLFCGYKWVRLTKCND